MGAIARDMERIVQELPHEERGGYGKPHQNGVKWIFRPDAHTQALLGGTALAGVQ
jgi:hypothetical protein